MVDPRRQPAALPDYIVVEIGSYCNRRCAWCPNGWHQRGRRREHMDEAVWRALLEDLGAAEYRGGLAFHNYNEPLADPSLYDKIAQVRRLVPDARPTVYSNGKLLNREVLERLRQAGARELRVTRYPQKRRMRAEPEAKVLLELLGALGIADDARVEDRERRLVAVSRAGSLKVLVGAPRIRFYTSRGNSVGLEALRAEAARDWPCYYPVASAAIDYHGKLKLCCHIYDTQQPEAHPYVVGDVSERPFTELWSSARMLSLREQLARADFSGLPLCASCSHRMTDRFLGRIEARRARAQR